MHDHPNALEFKYRLRSYIMGSNEGAYSEFTNVEVDDTPDLPLTGQLVQKLYPVIVSSTEELNCIDEPELENLHELTYDGLENLAGFLCCKLREPSIESGEGNSTFTWVGHFSEGGLHKPSDSFLLRVRELDAIFHSVNGDTIAVMHNFIGNLMSKSKDVKCSEKAKLLFFRSRMYFRLRELNQSLQKIQLGKRKMIKIIT